MDFGAIAYGILKAILESIGIFATDTHKTESKVKDAVIIRGQKPPTMSGAGRLESLRRRKGGLRPLSIVFVALIVTTGCTSRETTIERLQLVPTIIDVGAPVENGVKIAQTEEVQVMIFGPDGDPVESAGPVGMNLSGSVVVPPWRWMELLRTEAALGAALLFLTPDEEIEISEVLGKR